MWRLLGRATWLVPALCLCALAAPRSVRGEVTAPSGGESWEIGSVQRIAWSLGSGGNVHIELSRDDGTSFQTLFGNVPNDGQQDWIVTGPPTGRGVVRVTRLDDPSLTTESAANFTIPGVVVTQPNGDDVWTVGTQQTITWTGIGSGNVKIELSRDAGVTFDTLFANTPDDGAQPWTVTGPISGNCLVRITRLDATGSSDQSERVFLIVQTIGLTVELPNGNELWTVGSRQSIRWLGLGGGRVMIELSRDGGVTWNSLLDSTPDDGEAAWNVVGPPTLQALIRITRLSPPMVSDVSDAPFQISADPIAVTAPTGDAEWIIGTQQAIQWSSSGGGNVRLELSRDGGLSFETLFENTPNDGAQFWLVTGPPTVNAVVRVTSLLDATVTDGSDAFAVARGSLALAAPNGGDRWPIGSRQTITWTTTTGGSVRIELTRDSGTTWQAIFVNTPNQGSAQWTVTGPPSPTCRMRIINLQDPELEDLSAGDFAVTCDPLTLAIEPGAKRTATLALADCEAPNRPGSRTQLYTFSMPAAGLVTVELASAAFDPYLLLLGPDGAVIAQDDNGGGGTTARLDSIELAAGGPYTIEVTSAAAGGVGVYSLSLARFDITLLSPLGGETWKFGERRLITWRSGAPDAPVDIIVFRNGAPGAGGDRLAIGKASDGLFAWTVGPPAAPQAVVQVCIPYGSRGTQICDVSGALVLEPCTPGETRPCYDGPPATLGVGACTAGMQTCGSDGAFAPCVGEVLPQPEVCGDGVDQDCAAGDTACLPCPGNGTCADDDPCTADACIDGQCRNERPLGWALLHCRGGAVKDAVAALDTLCKSDLSPAVRKREQRRLGRLLATVARLARQAQASHSSRRCLARIAKAREQAARLQRRLASAAARGLVCATGAQTLARRTTEYAAAIVSAASCQPTP